MICSIFADMKRIVTIIAFLACLLSVSGQRNEVYNERIRSLQVIVNGEWTENPPVMRLHTNDELYIGFDDLTHTYHRYVYRIEHCEADWTVSDQIFESDYLAGFNGNPIEDEAEQSLNTTVLYNHYSIFLPNDNCSLKMSGNYRLTVFDEDNDNEKMFSVCFMVAERLMSSSLAITPNTDETVRKYHQQVDMNLSYGNLIVTDYERQLYTVVMQNGRWDNAVINPKPAFIRRDGLQWTHNRNLIFDAGNEYMKFEMFDAHRLSLNIDHRRNIDDYYHTFLMPNEERHSYYYDEDANGAFIIRNSDYYDVNRLCDYEFVHYQIHSPRVVGDVYLNGIWTNDQFTDEYRMTFNPQIDAYEAIVLQKQGYYNYQALVLDRDGRTHPLPAQGNFYETENSYQMLVYYKGNSDRTWRLVSFTNADYKP